MSDSSTIQIQGLIHRMSAGDPSARNELIERSYERLRRLTRKMLQDFPRVERWADADDVLQESVMRFLKALEAVPLATPTEFFRLAATQVRRELLDLIRRFYGPQGIGANHGSGIAKDGSAGALDPVNEGMASTYEPSRLSAWTEFHQRVETLPEPKREVFDLLWYQGLTLAEAAALLNVSESTIKRRWVEAKALVGEFL